MSDEAIVCVICGLEEKDPRKVVECAYCHKNEHFKCKNVIGNAVRKLREKTYFCSLECNNIYQQSTRNLAVESEVLKQLQNVLVEVRETRAELQTVKSTVGDIEKFQNFLSEKLDSVLDELKSVKEEQNMMKKDVQYLRGKQQATSDTVNQLELEVDRLNRASISKNAVLLGIPMKRNESVETAVRKVAAAVGYQLPEGAIVEAKRLSSKDHQQHDAKVPPVKVCFSEEQYKEELFSKKKNHGPLLASAVDSAFNSSTAKIVLRDELTPYGMELLKEVREFKDLTDIKFVWPGRNGAILIKKTEGSKVDVIRSRKDIERLGKLSSKRLLNSSSRSGSDSSSPTGEPSLKRRQ